MSKRHQHRSPNPDNPADWLGQPYIPRSSSFPWNRSGSPPFYMFLIDLVRHPSKRGCLLALGLVGIILLGWLALIAIGFIQDNRLGFWALLVLIGAAVLGTLAGRASARRRREAAHSRQRRHHADR